MKEQILRDLADKALTTKDIVPYLDFLYGIEPGCDYYRLAYFLAREMHPDIIVELGTQYARCTAHFAAGAPDARVITIDVVDCSKGDVFSQYPNITPIQSRSDNTRTLERFEDGTIDICFADTLHQTGHVLHEIEVWTPKMKPGGVWLIDDLREMPDLIVALPFAVKGTLVGLHTVSVEIPQNVVDVGFGYAIKG